MNRWTLFRFATHPDTEINKPRCLPFCFGLPLASVTDDLAVHIGRVFLAEGLQAGIALAVEPRVRSRGSTFKTGWSFRLQPSTLHFTKDICLS